MRMLFRPAAVAAGASILLAFSPPAGATDVQLTRQVLPPEAGEPVTFDDALGLAAKAPAVAGAEAAVAEQRRTTPGEHPPPASTALDSLHAGTTIGRRASSRNKHEGRTPFRDAALACDWRKGRDSNPRYRSPRILV